MMSFLILQGIIIGAAVAASLIYSCRCLMPAVSQRWQAASANSLSTASCPPLLRALGKRLQPTRVPGGCGSCSTGCCQTSPMTEQQLHFHQRSCK